MDYPLNAATIFFIYMLNASENHLLNITHYVFTHAELLESKSFIK
ncbi:21077_t:CDS:2 [Cetraspora pellucida]|uniref:21077_t:CDS:1 n=1 Tax=Cetraspora pellucida TaxID=1433469 RepID=A0A9N8VFL2_9GLOM|nr:21077_t:CDS:2 [Cetraspora pellucida]